MSATEQTLGTVHAYLQALVERNPEGITALFADKVDWFIPGNQVLAPWLGKRETKQDIAAFYSLLWNATEPVSAQVDHIIADNDFAVIVGEFSTRMLATGKIVDSVFSIHITVKDNLIVRYRLQEDSLAVAEALK